MVLAEAQSGYASRQPMLIVTSALFWFWALSRPLTEELKEAEPPSQAER